MMHAFLLAALTARLDGGHILNSGSTNAPAYEILVWSDGNARTISKEGARTVRIGTSLAQKFLSDVKKARAENAPGASCMKSASFGSRTTVAYHGWRSPDVSCPEDGTLAALAGDVTAIARLTAPAVTRRITLPPNEPRRVPESTRAPSPPPTS